MKKKTQKENWCPLMGDIGPPGGLYEKTIERARYFWGTKATTNRDSNGDVIQCCYHPDIATIKKARRIYDAWMVFRDEENKAWGEQNEAYQTLNLLCSADENMRQTYIEDIHIKFRIADINDVSFFEVLTIIVIAEANENIKIDENSALPFTLLKIAEDFNPDVILGRQRREQIKDWSSKGRAGRDEDGYLKAEWLTIAKEYPSENGYSLIATRIIERLNLNQKQHQTIRKWLSKNLKNSW